MNAILGRSKAAFGLPNDSWQSVRLGERMLPGSSREGSRPIQERHRSAAAALMLLSVEETPVAWQRAVGEGLLAPGGGFSPSARLATALHCRHINGDFRGGEIVAHSSVARSHFRRM
jgi:hypothetical protein